VLVVYIIFAKIPASPSWGILMARRRVSTQFIVPLVVLSSRLQVSKASQRQRQLCRVHNNSSLNDLTIKRPDLSQGSCRGPSYGEQESTEVIVWLGNPVSWDRDDAAKPLRAPASLLWLRKSDRYPGVLARNTMLAADVFRRVTIGKSQ
jgi:hypothetical protein